MKGNKLIARKKLVLLQIISTTKNERRQTRNLWSKGS
jgi:hypothetical protein